MINQNLLPYCLQQYKKDEWLLLNREYQPKPLGLFTNEFLQYHNYPIRLKISSKKIPWLNPNVQFEYVYLYQANSNPLVNNKLMQKYLQKLLFLADYLL
jgi:hypothetical protein